MINNPLAIEGLVWKLSRLSFYLDSSSVFQTFLWLKLWLLQFAAVHFFTKRDSGEAPEWDSSDEEEDHEVIYPIFISLKMIFFKNAVEMVNQPEHQRIYDKLKVYKWRFEEGRRFIFMYSAFCFLTFAGGLHF